MADIKTKKVIKDTIKKLDRTALYTEKVKDNLVNIKNKANYTDTENSSPNEYGGNRLSQSINVATHKGVNAFNKYGKKATKTTINNIKSIKNIKNTKGINNIAKKNIGIKNVKNITTKTKGAVQKGKKTIKTAKNTIKTTQNTAKILGKTAKATIKGAKKAFQIAKLTAKATVKGIKLAVKGAILAIKGILLATKALIAFLVAGRLGCYSYNNSNMLNSNVMLFYIWHILFK